MSDKSAIARTVPIMVNPHNDAMSIPLAIEKAYELSKRWLIVLAGEDERHSKRIGPFNLRDDADEYAAQRWGGECEYEIVGMIDVVAFEQHMGQRLQSHSEWLKYESTLRSGGDA